MSVSRQAVARRGGWRLFFAIFACLCLSPAGAPGGAEDPAPDLVSSENAFFEVVGEGRRSVSFVAQLGTFIAETYSTLLDLPQRYPQRVLVSLLPSDRYPLDEAWRVRQAPGGFVSLDLRWDESLSLETLCQAMTAALLVRQAVLLHGPDAGRRVGGWVGSALASDAYLELRPAMRTDFFRALAAEASVPALKAVLEKPLAEAGEAARRDGFWFQQGLRAAGWSAAEIAALVRAGLAGRDCMEIFRRRMRAEVNGFDPEVWWTGFWEAAPAAEMREFDGMTESRLWIADLAGLTGMVAGDGDGELRALWHRRDDAELRSVVRARRELLRLRLPSVNPVYHNSAVSLDELFESVLADRAAHDFIRGLARFLVEFEDARRLEMDVTAALDDGARSEDKKKPSGPEGGKKEGADGLP